MAKILPRISFVEPRTAQVMGPYWFTPADGSDEVKVEYSIGFIRDSEGKLKIVLHHSSLPFVP